MKFVLPFVVRANHNGTFDAVCTGCLSTSAAYVRAKEDLGRWHAKHSCDLAETPGRLGQGVVVALLRSA